MPRMLDLIRGSTVPATLVQSASKGALALPAQETIEILVYLATQSKVFREQARLTLAGWDEKSSIAAAASADTPQEVLAYLSDPRNLRPALLPALVENPSVSEAVLAELARLGSPEAVNVVVNSYRARTSEVIRQALTQNPNVPPAQLAALEKAAEELKEAKGRVLEHSETALPGEAGGAALQPESRPAAEAPDSPELDSLVGVFLAEHASELAAEGEKPFQPIGGTPEDLDPGPGATVEAASVPAQSEERAASSAAHPASPHPAHAAKVEAKRESTLQKIAKLDVSGRIQLAMKGTKEERTLLIRDGTKLVALAVLESPKISDGEVEKIASQKNILEAVLRAIPMKRKFSKNYALLLNLVFNPRTPIDLSLGLMKNILIGDLKNLAGNKEVSETIRKLALRMYKQKLEKKD